MTPSYTASDIEVLTGLEPVRRRPGMYTDTRSPNHLVHEVVDNSLDEALSGHCRNIAVVVHKDGSVSVDDDGREVGRGPQVVHRSAPASATTAASRSWCW